ncbi:MAG: hypothetical protein HY217_01505, partial [Candidatus Rokubacteria bacterium]|nr:hypothetical protein [Candidatus Rokubacteria bacterium]
MSYDLVIKDGMVIDGSGMPRYRADVGVRHGRIAAIGRIRERARGLLGSARYLLMLARRDHGRDGQLRIHARPLRRGRQAPRHPQPGACRGHRGRGDGRGHRLDVDHVPGVSRPGGVPAQGHQLRGLHRSLGPAHLRHGRTGVRGAGRRGRPAGDGARAARRHPRRRRRLHDLALAESRDPRSPPRCEPGRRVGGGAAVGRRDGRHERRHLRAGRRGGGPHRRRYPGPARVPRAAARSGRRDRPARDLGPVQPAGGARGLAHLPRPARGDRRRGRPHVRPGAQPRAGRAALVLDQPAVRPAPRMEGAAGAAARRAAAPAARSGAAPPPGRGRARARRAARDRGGAAAGRVRVDLRHGRGGGAAPLGGGGGARAGRGPGRGDDRPRA